MNDNKQNLYVAKLHWIIFTGPVLLFCLALVMGLYLPLLKDTALVIIVLSLIWFIVTWINYQCSSLTIREKQVIFRTGMLVRRITEINTARIESIDIRQSIPGSILSYGALLIAGTGGTRQGIHFIDKPLTCRRYIEQVMHGNQSGE